MKLEGSQNYQVWATDLKGVTLSNQVWKVMNETIPQPISPANTSDSQWETHTARLEDWEEAEEMTQRYILQIIKQDPASHLTDSMNAPKMFETLKNMYKMKGYTEHHLHWKTINRSDLSKYKNVSEYTEAMKKVRTMIKNMRHQVLDWQMTSSFLHELDKLYTTFITTILTAWQLRADSEPMKPDFNRLIAQLINIEKCRDTSSNKSSFFKALKTESAGCERSSERKKGINNSSSIFNLNSVKCSVCNSQWHMNNRCWIKSPALALEKWREENKSRIDKYRQKSKNSNNTNTSEGRKKKPMNDMIARVNKTDQYWDHIWYMNTAASYHMTFNASLFDIIRSSNKEAELTDETPITVMNVETITLSILINSELLEQPLHKVYYMPELNNNLLLIGYLEKKGFLFEAFNEVMQIREGKEIRMKTKQINTLYILNQPLNVQIMMIRKDTHDVVTWHQWLAHLNEKDIHWLTSMLTEITGLKGHIKECEVCTLNKTHCQLSHQTSTRAIKPLEWVHTDLRGGESTLTMSVNWNKYYILYIDDCTWFRWLNVLKTKDKAMESFWKFNSMMETQFNAGIWRFWTDQSEEFKSDEMKEYLAEKGIIWELTVLYAHKQNGTAERGNWTIQKKIRMSLIDTQLSETLWAEALSTAVYLTNRSLTSQLNTTPYEALHGDKPDLLKLWVFECTAYVFDEHAKDRGKMTARVWKGVHLGYSMSSNQYQIYHTEKRKVFEHWDVKFHKGKNPTQLKDSDNNTDSEPDSERGNQSEIDSLLNTLQREELGHLRCHIDHTNPANEGESHYNNQYEISERDTTSNDDDSEANDTQQSLRDINYESPSPKWGTSGLNNLNNLNDLNDINDWSEIDSLSDEEESEEDLTIESLNNFSPSEEGLWRSEQNTQHSDYTQLHCYRHVNMVIAKALAVNALNKPITYNDAVTCREAPQWKFTMKEEITSLHKNKMWNLMTLPKNRKMLQGKWVYKRKTTETSTQYKAQWVIKGFMQQEGINYTETYTSVINKATTKVVMTMAAIKEYYIK